MAQTNPSPCPDECQGHARRGSKPRFSRRLTGFRRLCYFEFTPVGEADFPAAIPRRSVRSNRILVITGFNTDIEFEGVTYHVQTEDKGLDTPLILSLVYVGGAIIASKRTPYQDLVAGGFDESVLAERLQRQHKLICAAIRAGRIEELKRMSAGGAQQGKPAAAEARPPSAKAKTQRKKKSGPLREVSQNGSDAANGAGEAGAPVGVEDAAGTVAGGAGEAAGDEIVILTTLVDEIAALGEGESVEQPRFITQPLET